MKKRNRSISQLTLILGLVLMISSCEKEYEKHCEFQGDQEKICKELRYESEVLVEAVSYEYGSNGLVSLKLHENKSGKNLGHVAYTYNGENDLISEVFKNTDQEVLIANTMVYGSSQLLKIASTEAFGVEQVTYYSYNSSAVSQEKTYIDGELKFNKVYQYFDDDTLSYDALLFDGDSVLISVDQQRRFDASTTRIESYNELGELLGYRVLLSDSQGELVEKREYNGLGSLLHQEEYRYGQWGIEEYNFLSATNPNKKIKYLRFN